MSWLEFFAQVTENLAWPAVALVIALVFRRRIEGLFGDGISKVKLKDVEVLFRRKVEQVKVDAEKLAAQNPQTHNSPREDGTHFPGRLDNNEFQALLELSPRSAIIEAWRDVEFEARNALLELAPETAGGPFIRVLQELEKRAVLDRDSLKLLLQMRDVRNQAVHVRELELDRETALEFIDSVVLAKNHFAMMKLERKIKDDPK